MVVVWCIKLYKTIRSDDPYLATVVVFVLVVVLAKKNQAVESWSSHVCWCEA